MESLNLNVYKISPVFLHSVSSWNAQSQSILIGGAPPEVPQGSPPSRSLTFYVFKGVRPLKKLWELPNPLRLFGTPTSPNLAIYHSILSSLQYHRTITLLPFLAGHILLSMMAHIITTQLTHNHRSWVSSFSRYIPLPGLHMVAAAAATTFCLQPSFWSYLMRIMKTCTCVVGCLELKTSSTPTRVWKKCFGGHCYWWQWSGKNGIQGSSLLAELPARELGKQGAALTVYSNKCSLINRAYNYI